MDEQSIKTETPDQSTRMIKEEIVEKSPTSTPSIMDGGIVESAEQPLLSQGERNQRQMNEDESLINLVQKFPIIYDRTNRNYQNKEQVRHVWSVIAENANRTRKYVDELSVRGILKNQFYVNKIHRDSHVNTCRRGFSKNFNSLNVFYAYHSAMIISDISVSLNLTWKSNEVKRFY